MEILKQAVCGTLLSNDCLLMIGPGQGHIRIEVESSVKESFGDQIEKVIREKLEELGVTSCNLSINDKGALDYAIKARVEVVVNRSNE